MSSSKEGESFVLAYVGSDPEIDCAYEAVTALSPYDAQHGSPRSLWQVLARRWVGALSLDSASRDWLSQ